MAYVEVIPLSSFKEVYLGCFDIFKVSILQVFKTNIKSIKNRSYNREITNLTLLRYRLAIKYKCCKTNYMIAISAELCLIYQHQNKIFIANDHINLTAHVPIFTTS